MVRRSGLGTCPPPLTNEDLATYFPVASHGFSCDAGYLGAHASAVMHRGTGCRAVRREPGRSL